MVLALLIVMQAFIGIATLVLVVPLSWALAHHAFAIVVLGFATAHWQATKGSYPLPGRGDLKGKQAIA